MSSGFGPMEVFIIVAVISAWIFALIDVLKNDFAGNSKLPWFLVVLFGSFVGAVLYLFIGRKQKKVISGD